MTRTISILIAMILGLLVAAPLARAERADDLRARFERRYPELRELKNDGKIGETSAGMVEAVNGKSLDDSASKLVSDENADRKELYDLIAKKEGTTSQMVAERNAKRNFEKAKHGDWLKGGDGKWTKKA
jgi:uncharacterized protein YdbL (DUF1318 family)